MRVEVVKRGHTHWHRIVHGDNELDFSIAVANGSSARPGSVMADLLEVTAQPFEHVDDRLLVLRRARPVEAMATPTAPMTNPRTFVPRLSQHGDTPVGARSAGRLSGVENVGS